MGKGTTLLLREMEVPLFKWKLDYHFVNGKTTTVERDETNTVSMEMGLPLCRGEREYTIVKKDWTTSVSR